MNKIKITILYNSYKFISKVLLETFLYITLFKDFSKKDKKEDKYEKFNKKDITKFNNDVFFSFCI